MDRSQRKYFFDVHLSVFWPLWITFMTTLLLKYVEILITSINQSSNKLRLFVLTFSSPLPFSIPKLFILLVGSGTENTFYLLLPNVNLTRGERGSRVSRRDELGHTWVNLKTSCCKTFSITRYRSSLKKL